jgi:hypothetical protein
VHFRKSDDLSDESKMAYSLNLKVNFMKDRIQGVFNNFGKA